MVYRKEKTPKVTKNSAGAEKSPMRCSVLFSVESGSQSGMSNGTLYNLVMMKGRRKEKTYLD